MTHDLVTDYVLAGHERLFPAGNKGDGDHLDADLTMPQQPLPPGHIEARILYLPCFTRMRLDVRRAVRRFWVKRNRKELGVLPTHAETYRVTPAVAKQIDEAARSVEAALSDVNVRMNVHYEIGTPQEGARHRVGAEPRFARTLSAAGNPMIWVRFTSSWVDPSLNSAWEALWEALGASFKPVNRIRAVVKYPIRPERLVEALNS